MVATAAEAGADSNGQTWVNATGSGGRAPTDANNVGMARDPGEVMANQAMMNQLAPYLAVGDLASRWSPKLPTISGSYSGIVGGNLGASMKLGPVLDLDAGVKIGMYTNQKDDGTAELLFGAKINGSGSLFGGTAERKLGYEYGVDSKLSPVVRPINSGSFDYRGFDPLDLSFETKIKTPVGNFKIGIDFRPIFNVNPPRGVPPKG